MEGTARMSDSRAERLRLIIADVGKFAGSIGDVTEADVYEAKLAIAELERGGNPPPTDREKTDAILSTVRPIW
jgi:hypothetical protein